MDHHCHANGCTTPTDPKMFVCLPHWRALRADLQKAVVLAFKRRGGKPSAPITYPYMLACAEAVEYLAEKDGVPTENSYRRTAKLLAECMCDPAHPRYDPEFAERHPEFQPKEKA